ncbi:MAG: hypothetical protein JWO32_1554 [Bacteroidetes bacterium]|nr:hypothetical protein [Bacteroidota bacterium]
MKTSANLNKNEPSYQKELQIDLGLLSKGEVARILKVSACTVDRYVKNGWLNLVKWGSSQQARCYFKREEVLNFVEERCKQGAK